MSKSFDLGDGIKLELVEIPAGNFMKRWDNNKLIKINKLSMAKHPITNAQWNVIMGNNPSWWASSKLTGLNQPVVAVNWHQSKAYCEQLSKKTKHQFRLPTEPEWEYAIRGGTTTKYHFGNDDNQLDQYAWYDKNSGGQTHEVMKKKPNQYGLYDMMGNVWEWCEDEYNDDHVFRAVRGGSFDNGFGSCVSSCRTWCNWNYNWHHFGFRVVLLV